MINFLLFLIFVFLLTFIIVYVFKDLKKQNNAYKKKIVLTLLYALIAFNIILVGYTILPDAGVIVKYKTFTTDYEIRTFPYNYNVYCEKGVYIESYKYLNEKSIYSCMTLDKNGLCAGVRKQCLVYHIEWKWSGVK